MKRLPGGKKTILAAVGLVIIMLLLGYRLLLHRPAVAVLAVKRAEIQGTVHGPGTVQSKVPVTVSTKITGILEKLHADQGDLVKQGELLAELDAAELKAKAAASRASLSRSGRDLGRSRAAAAKAQANLALAGSNHRRDLEVFKPGYISQAAMDITLASLKVAESEAAEAQANVLALEAAQAQAASEVRVAEASLNYTRIVAPMDGLITVRKAEVGATVAPGAPIFQMVDLGQIWMAAWIDQAQVAQLREGQTARITLRSGRVFQGRVVRLNKEADTVTRELEVNVLFDQLPDPLVIGEEGEVDIATGKETAPLVPLSTLFPFKGQMGVLVVDQGKVTLHPVSMGLREGERAAVTKGLREGDLVVLHPDGNLLGKRVRPVVQAAAGRED